MNTYCRGCKWLKLGMADFMLFTYRCHHPSNTIEDKTPMRTRKRHPTIWFANSYNDCQLFERR